jgi:hypothetical protein
VFQTRQLLIATIALAGYGCGVGIAKTGPPPDPFNVQVRVTVHSSAALPAVQTGTLIYLSADSLFMNSEDDGSRLAVPVPHIAKLEVYRMYIEAGLNGAEKGEVVGSLIGILAALVGATMTAPAGGTTVGEWVDLGATEGAAIGAEIGRDDGAGASSLQWVEVSVIRLREELCQCWIQEAAAES